MRELHDSLDELEDVCSLIDRAIMDDPPLVIKDEGGTIKEGYNEEIDIAAQGQDRGKDSGLPSWKRESGKKLGSRTCGSSTTRSLAITWRSPIPTKTWCRTTIPANRHLTNAERYITPELKELEDVILGAEDKLFSIEYDLFYEIRENGYPGEVLRIQATARALCRRLMCLLHLAVVSRT